MGYNTTVVVYNDSLHDIETDPEFGKRLVAAIREQAGGFPRPKATGDGKVTVFARGDNGSSSAALVVEQHHADETSLVAVGGNTAAVIYKQLGGSLFTKKGQDAILQQALLSKWSEQK